MSCVAAVGVGLIGACSSTPRTASVTIEGGRPANPRPLFLLSADGGGGVSLERATAHGGMLRYTASEGQRAFLVLGSLPVFWGAVPGVGSPEAFVDLVRQPTAGMFEGWSAGEIRALLECIGEGVRKGWAVDGLREAVLSEALRRGDRALAGAIERSMASIQMDLPTSVAVSRLRAEEAAVCGRVELEESPSGPEFVFRLANHKLAAAVRLHSYPGYDKWGPRIVIKKGGRVVWDNLQRSPGDVRHVGTRHGIIADIGPGDDVVLWRGACPPLEPGRYSLSWTFSDRLPLKVWGTVEDVVALSGWLEFEVRLTSNC